ncbi:MAG: hypothetical protein KAS94_09860, partial [Desulfobulbaceae bacterium]|nr:hypothetical protein [Desulfobulbaceae bacterium]
KQKNSGAFCAAVRSPTGIHPQTTNAKQTDMFHVKHRRQTPVFCCTASLVVKQKNSGAFCAAVRPLPPPYIKENQIEAIISLKVALGRMDPKALPVSGL